MARGASHLLKTVKEGTVLPNQNIPEILLDT